MLNKVELVGIVGQVRKTEIGGDLTGVNFSLAVNLAFKDNDGTRVIETTWVPCVAFVKPGNETPAKGDRIRVKGRLRARRYTYINGAEHSGLNVFVNSFEVSGR